MAEMARAIGRCAEAENYDQLRAQVAARFAQDYLNGDGTLKVETQTADVLALAFGLLPDPLVKSAAQQLADRIAKKGYRMATGFLGTKSLLPVLSANGHHDLACRLFQSRKFPSWGYEVSNGANSVWERWDSFTQEHGFNGLSGDQNAAMNSFSHYSFGAVTEWMFRSLAGIDTDGPGFKQVIIRPGPPTPGSNPDHPPINWVKASYGSPRGKIVSEWKRGSDHFELTVIVPANTSATVYLPAKSAEGLTEGGKGLARTSGVRFLRQEGDRALLAGESGSYQFGSRL